MGTVAKFDLTGSRRRPRGWFGWLQTAIAMTTNGTNSILSVEYV